jgi:hypothetical protein
MVHEKPDEDAAAVVCQWARQTLLFAINLSHRGQRQAPDWSLEAEQVARRLFDETKAECPEAPIGDAVLIYAGKVLSWCSERRHKR